MVSRVVVLNDASIARGGATGLVLKSIRNLRARGVPVTLVTGDDGTNDELRGLGVEVVALGERGLTNRTFVKAAARGIHNNQARSTVASWIADRDSPTTVYHLHGWAQILSPSVFVALRPVARRTLIHAHDFFLACPNGAYMDFHHDEPCSRVPLGMSCLTTNCDKRSYLQKLWRVGRQAMLLRTWDKTAPWSAVLMIHEKMASPLVRAGIPPALLRPLRNPAEPFVSERIRAEGNAAFFYVGRLDAEKGIAEAVAAAATASVRLEVIGEGPLRGELERRHRDVTFHGWCSRAEIAARITGARALVMPSRYPEPFGLVAAEASMSGLPVILSRTAFLADDLVSHGIGLSYDPSDAGSLSSAIARLRDMPASEVRPMSDRAFSGTAALALTEDRWTDELMTIYAASIASANGV